MLCSDTATVELLKNLHEGRAVEESKTIKEDYDPNESGRDEQICVPAQPQVVQGHLLAKVVPDMRTHTNTHTCTGKKMIQLKRWGYALIIGNYKYIAYLQFINIVYEDTVTTSFIHILFNIFN